MIHIEKLIKARLCAAKLVEKLGDKYLPFFERMNQEVLAAQKNQDVKALALRVAAESD